ncbi:uncharacterized protein TRIVIDRAFT_58093 [Trichoderma virens Gv29-8]|uniref:Killer toxin Kp4 domain-containing protein n=1 Tax=Hypocrea virens (strain Gv29-8 / FGSC 10586) TaxID=413071 RepID=G9MQ69_HYPVG|nr:uncharacterized protein TRIVIDRAFT_58093 [Trichoderma virens Gv29-8]EHK24016.1 hypothetical protein TRIVIDRAFT_58093 [Trichoderma virens Gv29-8]UKZ50326.1 hypothetical protein TrVGV298_004584 [Trichoderma virens]UKZ76756.1 hypothetical protein TrVFT333_004466 [Trichoderma virens FT-333]
MRSSSFIAVAAAAAQGVAGLGINCHGDVYCGTVYLNGGTLSDFENIFNKLDDKRKYQNGEDVGCVQHLVGHLTGNFMATICAYIQNAKDDTTGATLKSVYKELQQYGCAVCGSVPLLYAKGDDDVNHGELTINIVDDLPENCKINEPCSAS